MKITEATKRHYCHVTWYLVLDLKDKILPISFMNSYFRFFTNPKSGQADNPPPGTVVDDVVTLPERHDFFLISQSVRQGTVNPTSYNIIHNESGLTPDILQRLTYKV